MKVMIRKSGTGLSAYVPKKDLEEPIIETEMAALWGGYVLLKNGWKLVLPEMPSDTRLPVTVNARKISADGDEE